MGVIEEAHEPQRKFPCGGEAEGGRQVAGQAPPLISASPTSSPHIGAYNLTWLTITVSDRA